MIVALYKLWRGRMWLDASLESIYPHVGAIVALVSDVSWTGERGNNTTEPLAAWKKQHDWQNKISIIRLDCKDQTAQYAYGFMHIAKTYPGCDWVQIIDGDEVWDDQAWEQSRWYLKWAKSARALKSRMYGYIKSPLYRIIEDPSACKPVVFCRPYVQFSGVRGNLVEPATVMPEVFVHHFTAVQETENDIFTKLLTSTAGDGCGTTVDVERWRKEVWDRIPNVRNFHYNTGCEYVWRGCETITLDDLPITCRSIARRYMEARKCCR